MSVFSLPMRIRLFGFFVLLLPVLVRAQGNYATEGGEYNIGGVQPGEQVFPQASIRTTGGYVVWQDNLTDGFGLGISARKLDSSLSGTLSSFRVNSTVAEDQERPSVSMLNGGGAVFVWQGGKQGFQHIYARFLDGNDQWLAGDVRVNSATNVFQLESTVTTLANGNVVVVWSSFNQVFSNSFRDVYSQILSPTGEKVGGETLVNQATAFNQRTASIAPLSDGRYVIVWVSEQQRFENSVDVFGRIYNANGVAATGEFLVNTDTNVCANPAVAPTSDGGFAVTWMEKDVGMVTRTNSWDIFMRPFSGSAIGGSTRRVNTHLRGDQLYPKIAAMGSDFMVAWTSMGQDGSREGVYGQFLRGDGTLYGSEFRVNSTTLSQQILPCVASDGIARFLAVWSSYTTGTPSFDLYAQRYVNTTEALPAPGAPIVSVISSNSLSVTWPPVQGFSVANYDIYADGSPTATATTTNIAWTATGLASSSTHSYRLAYVLTDGRRSPLSAATTNTTYAGGATWGGIPQEWMMSYFDEDIFQWPSPNSDSDGDGASLLQEFLAGTNPTDPNSVLRQRVVQTPQGPFLHWNTQPGLIYQVQTSVNMGPWQNLGGPRFASGYLDSMYVGGYNSGFFRVMRLR